MLPSCVSVITLPATRIVKISPIPAEKIACYDTVAHAAGALAEDGGNEELYVVTCFSDRDKLLRLVKKEAD